MMPQWLMRARAADGDRARGTSPRATQARAVRSGLAIVLLIPHLTGCFHYVPASQSVVPTGTGVSVGINDRGRVALEEPVGPGVRRIIGNVLESTDTSLVLAVNTVEYSDFDIPVRWAGERVDLSRAYVADIRERQLSRSRSLLMTGLLAVGAVAVSLITIAGLGGGDPAPRGPGDDRDPD